MNNQPPPSNKGKIIEFHQEETPCVLEIKMNLPEGDGRFYNTGGFLCEICPYCRGSRDWCPVKE